MTLRLKACIIFSVLCLFVFWTSVASAQQDNSGNDDIIKPTYKSIIGTHESNGGCSYKGSMMLKPGEKALRAEIVDQDTSSCGAVLKEGAPRELEDKSSPRGESSGSSSVGYTGKPTGSDPQSSGYFRTWMEDPVGLDLNSVTNYLTWSWDGFVVYNPWGGYQLWWLSGDGWYPLTDCSGCFSFRGPYWNGWGFEEQTTILYSIDNWLWGFDWTYWNPNLVVGGPQGQLYGYYSGGRENLDTPMSDKAALK